MFWNFQTEKLRLVGRGQGQNDLLIGDGKSEEIVGGPDGCWEQIGRGLGQIAGGKGGPGDGDVGAGPAHG